MTCMTIINTLFSLIMKKMLLPLRLMVALLTVLLVYVSCADADGVYSNITAHFSFRPVDAVPALHRACTVPGQFCKITDPIGSQGRYKVESPGSNADYIVKTQTEYYTAGSVVLGMGGLIIGMPTIPEMLSDQIRVVCFDASCPNCKGQNMQLQTGGYAQCQLCLRTYDMNNQGIVSKGDGVRALYRLYCSYNAALLQVVVNNR